MWFCCLSDKSDKVFHPREWVHGLGCHNNCGEKRNTEARTHPACWTPLKMRHSSKGYQCHSDPDRAADQASIIRSVKQLERPIQATKQRPHDVQDLGSEEKGSKRDVVLNKSEVITRHLYQLLNVFPFIFNKAYLTEKQRHFYLKSTSEELQNVNVAYICDKMATSFMNLSISLWTNIFDFLIEMT